MQALYLATVTSITIQPRLLSVYPRRNLLGMHDWEAYLVKHGTSLAGLLARLPCFTVLTVYKVQCHVVYQAIVFQPCRLLASIEFMYGTPPGFGESKMPWGAFCGASPLLYLALAKGHLPSWDLLAVFNKDHALIAAEAVQAGYLTRVKRLKINWYGDGPTELQSLLEAFQAYNKEELGALELEVPETDDLDTRDIMHEFLSWPVCSSLREIKLTPRENDSSSSAMLFMSDYLRNGGAGGRPSLRELYFFFLMNDGKRFLPDRCVSPGWGPRNGTKPGGTPFRVCVCRRDSGTVGTQFVCSGGLGEPNSPALS